MKITRRQFYFPSIIIIIQSILTYDSYLLWKEFLREIEIGGMLVSIWFRGFDLLYAVLVICIFEFFIRIKFWKILARTLLVTLIFAQLWSMAIPPGVPYDAIVNTAIFSAVLAVLISIFLGIKNLIRIFDKSKSIRKNEIE